MIDYFLIGDGCSVDGDTESDFDESFEDSELETSKQEVKYEEKYLDDIRKLNKEFIFDDEEKELEEKKKDEIFITLNNNYKEKMNSVNMRLKEIENILKKDDSAKLLKEELVEEYNTLIDELEQQQKEFKEKAEFEARKMIIDNKLNRLKDCFVMEKTPLGNVLMFYNHSRDAFEFYSDNTIPYRYLETVGRKYVKIFNCRPIFVDMEEELRICEERIEKEEKEKEKEALKLLDSIHQQVKPIEQKKSVFAKFKSYNKEAGTGRVNTCPPPKNSIPNKPVTEKESSEKLLLKENANRYTYEGKFSNFNFLKKVERKMVDKKYGMSFSDFKKQLICGNN
jgi:hypothetical protein